MKLKLLSNLFVFLFLCFSASLLSPAHALECGINIDPANPGGHPSPSALGNTGWVRIEFKDCTTDDPISDASIATYRNVLSAYKSAGIKTLVILDYLTYPDASTNIAAFAKRSGQIASQLGGLIDAYEIWNEPDHPRHFPLSPGTFKTILEQVGSAVRSADSGATVVLGGLANGNPQYITALGGIPPSIGAVAIHPYVNGVDGFPPGSPGDLRATLNAFLNVSEGRPIWITEMGLDTQDQDQVAQYMQKFYTLLRNEFSATVPVVTWFAWSDAMVSPFGIVNSNQQPKAAYDDHFTAGCQVPPPNTFAIQAPISAQGGQGCGGMATPWQPPAGPDGMPTNWDLPPTLQMQYCSITENNPFYSRPAICGFCTPYVPQPVRSCAGNFTYSNTLPYMSSEGGSCTEGQICEYNPDDCTVAQPGFFNCNDLTNPDGSPRYEAGHDPCDCPEAPNNCQSQAYQNADPPPIETDQLIVTKGWKGRFTLDASSVIIPFVGNDTEESRERYIADYLDGTIYYISQPDPFNLAESNPPNDPLGIFDGTYMGITSGNYPERYNRIYPIDPRFFSYTGIFPKLAPQAHQDKLKIQAITRMALQVLYGWPSFDISLMSWTGQTDTLAGNRLSILTFFYPLPPASVISNPPIHPHPTYLPYIPPLPPGEFTDFFYGECTWEEYRRKMEDWKNLDGGLWYRLWSYVPVASREDAPFEFRPVPQQPAAIIPLNASLPTDPQLAAHLSGPLGSWTATDIAHLRKFFTQYINEEDLAEVILATTPIDPSQLAPETSPPALSASDNIPPTLKNTSKTSNVSETQNNSLLKSQLASVVPFSSNSNINDRLETSKPGNLETSTTLLAQGCTTLICSDPPVGMTPDGFCSFRGFQNSCDSGCCASNIQDPPSPTASPAPPAPSPDPELPPVPTIGVPGPTIAEPPEWIDGQIPHLARTYFSERTIHPLIKPLPYAAVTPPAQPTPTFGPNYCPQLAAAATSNQLSTTSLELETKNQVSESDSQLTTQNFESRNTNQASQVSSPPNSIIHNSLFIVRSFFSSTFRPLNSLIAQLSPSDHIAIKQFNNQTTTTLYPSLSPTPILLASNQIFSAPLNFINELINPIKTAFAQTSSTIENTGINPYEAMNPACRYGGTPDNPSQGLCSPSPQYYYCVSPPGVCGGTNACPEISLTDIWAESAGGGQALINYTINPTVRCREFVDENGNAIGPGFGGRVDINGGQTHNWKAGQPFSTTDGLPGVNPVIASCGGTTTFALTAKFSWNGSDELVGAGCCADHLSYNCDITLDDSCNIVKTSCNTAPPPPPDPPSCTIPPLGTIPQCNMDIRTGPGDNLCGQTTYDLVVPLDSFFNINPNPIMNYSDPDAPVPGDCLGNNAGLSRCGAALGCLDCKCPLPLAFVCEHGPQVCSTNPDNGEEECSCPQEGRLAGGEEHKCCGPGSTDGDCRDVPDWFPLGESACCPQNAPYCTTMDEITPDDGEIASACCVQPYGATGPIYGDPQLCASVLPAPIQLSYATQRGVHLATNLPYLKKIRDHLYDEPDAMYKLLTPLRGPETAPDSVPWYDMHDGDANGWLTIRNLGAEPSLGNSVNGNPTETRTPFFFPYLGGIQDATTFVRDCLTSPASYNPTTGTTTNGCSASDLVGTSSTIYDEFWSYYSDDGEIGLGENYPPGSVDDSLSVACDGSNIGELAIFGSPTDRAADQHADLNLKLRGWQSLNTSGNLIDIGFTEQPDASAPQLITMNAGGPPFPDLLRVNNWDWGSNSRGAPITSPWDVSMARMSGTGSLTVPDSGYNIGHGCEVIVLYADSDSLTLKYTREDDVVRGYAIHVVDVAVNPALLAAYNQLNSAGRTVLPALAAGQSFGTSNGQAKVVIRDTGQFMDPRSRLDWWQGF